jgi:hypothetical protein
MGRSGEEACLYSHTPVTVSTADLRGAYGRPHA